jgi:uncharacterized delta-60 repeat protein
LPPGDLDTSFAGNGKKAINFGGTDAARAVLVQPDGRILLAGGGGPASSFCAARLRTNGNLDTTFGATGKRKVDFGSPDEAAFGAALQPDGKIVLVGDSHVQPAVVRLKRNGTRDSAFSGDGRKLFSWGAIGRVQAVIVLSGGKLLLGGFSGPEGGNIQVARMNANGGGFDTSFGTAGVATVDFGGDDFGMAMARQANGRIVIAGRSSAAGAVVARLRTTGMLDPDFGTGGKVTLGKGTLTAVLVQPDRKLVVAGNADNPDEMTVTRLNTNGTPDTGFGNQGTASFKFGNLANPLGGAALQPDGKIVVAGYSQDGEVVAVARLTKTGTFDATFGSAGKATVDFGAAMFGLAVALQKNGRIVVAGQLSGSDDFAVTRLLG